MTIAKARGDPNVQVQKSAGVEDNLAEQQESSRSEERRQCVAKPSQV